MSKKVETEMKTEKIAEAEYGETIKNLQNLIKNLSLNSDMKKRLYWDVKQYLESAESAAYFAGLEDGRQHPEVSSPILISETYFFDITTNDLDSVLNYFLIPQDEYEVLVQKVEICRLQAEKVAYHQGFLDWRKYRNINNV